MTIREQVLNAARQAVEKDRNATYGEPEDNFEDIAGHWRVYLKGRDPATLNSVDVAVMNILQKCARLRTSPAHQDHYVDIAGYAACGAQCAGTAESWACYKCRGLKVDPDGDYFICDRHAEEIKNA